MFDEREEASWCNALTGAYGLLARVFAREVDIEFYRVLQRLETCSPYWAGAIEPGTHTPVSTDVKLEGLAVEYCRLFLAPGPLCSPYGSVQLGEARLGGRTEQRVLTFATSAGLDVKLEPPILAADHVAVVFETLARLYERGATSGVSHTAEEFLRTLVLPWVPGLLGAIQATTTGALYARAADLGLALLQSGEIAETFG